MFPATVCEQLTVVAEDKETGSREVGVELDEDDVGGRVDGLQSRVPTKLANLRRGLVWTVPAYKHTHTDRDSESLCYKESAWKQKTHERLDFLYRTIAEQSRPKT